MESEEMRSWGEYFTDDDLAESFWNLLLAGKRCLHCEAVFERTEVKVQLLSVDLVQVLARSGGSRPALDAECPCGGISRVPGVEWREYCGVRR